MKILWISDFCLKHTKGGAQRSDDILIQDGLNNDLDIVWFNFDSDPSLLEEDYDHVISTNLDEISKRSPQIINWLQYHPSHSRLEHDMNAYLSVADRKLLFSNCKNTFFLTDYHYEIFKNSYGDFFKNVKIIQDPVDVNLFSNHGLEREDKILYAGFMHPLKGMENFFNYALANPEMEFVVAGWGTPLYEFVAKAMPNVEYLGTIPYSDMPAIYNKYKILFYHPFIQEPFCRSVCEAMLCGMELDVNAQKIGCMHECSRVGLERFKENCKNASKDFWSHIVREDIHVMDSVDG
jgi:glycosyltransferase involved in cell wall biosynthesis